MQVEHGRRFRIVQLTAQGVGVEQRLNRNAVLCQGDIQILGRGFVINDADILLTAAVGDVSAVDDATDFGDFAVLLIRDRERRNTAVGSDFQLLD